ncbi:MAG: FKBP-type peptidyl-prolyl cis-trans isomerase [Thermoplasmata archaeon]
MKAVYYAITIILVLIIAVVGTYFGYQSLSYKPNYSDYVKNGYTVSIYYYGFIIINGTKYIFDTNIKYVAQNNQTYIKAPIFRYHPPFDPFNFTVGSDQVIKGLSLGILNWTVGEKGIIYVPPSLGYPYNSSKIVYLNATENIPRYQEISINEFRNRTGQTPLTGMTARDNEFGWNDIVISVNSLNNSVLIMNDAQLNQIYYPYGTNVTYAYRVTYSNQTDIELNIITQDNTVLPNGVYVSSVQNNRIALNYNFYLAGKPLYFYVELINIVSK